MSHKLIGVIFLFVILTLILSSVQYFRGRKAVRLGLVPRGEEKPCRGSLVVVAKPSGEGKCRFEAEVKTENCEGKEWYVFEGDKCLGTYICKKKEVTSPSTWKCIWEDDKGRYTFTLCIDWTTKSMYEVTC